MRFEWMIRFAIATLLVWGLVMGLAHGVGIKSDAGDAVAAAVAIALTATGYAVFGLARVRRIRCPDHVGQQLAGEVPRAGRRPPLAVAKERVDDRARAIAA